MNSNLIKVRKSPLLESVFLVVALTATFFVYNNFTKLDIEIQKAVLESQELQKDIDGVELSQRAKNILIRQKVLVLNYISLKSRAESCADILSYDSTMFSGNYILYVGRNPSKPALYQCTISNRQVTKETYIKHLENPNLISGSSNSFYKTVTLNNSTVGGTDRAFVAAIRGMPQLISQISAHVCVPNVDFGFDTDGIWVKNGCSATFKVPVTMPLYDKSLVQGLNPNMASPILGYYTVDGDSTNIIIYGWACEKSNSEQVNVQIYAGGPAGIGALVAGGFAGNGSEPAVSAACGTTGIGHRFSISVPLNKLAGYRGQPLYAHGISSSIHGTSNGELLPNRSIKVPDNSINGYLDLVQGSNGMLEVAGWACSMGVDSPINAKLFVGGPASSGRFLAETAADISNEVGVNKACKNSGGHRFKFKLPYADVFRFAGKRLYVHGIAPVGSGANNLTIANSGSVTVPWFGVKGNIDAVTATNAGVDIRGWACQEGLSEPIAVRLFAGGPSGVGKMISSDVVANSPSENGVRNACNVATGDYRFRISLTAAQVAAYRGQKVYIYGIVNSMAEANNALITNFGTFAIP